MPSGRGVIAGLSLFVVRPLFWALLSLAKRPKVIGTGHVSMKNTCLCRTKYCRKNKAKTGHYCYSCVRRKYNQRHPLRNAYHVLKNNAKRRGKPFTITMDEWLQWCKKHDYTPTGGKPSWPEFRSRPSVDRIKSRYGYHIWNIQKLSVSDNSKKSDKWPTNF